MRRRWNAAGVVVAKARVLDAIVEVFSACLNVGG